MYILIKLDRRLLMKIQGLGFELVYRVPSDSSASMIT